MCNVDWTVVTPILTAALSSLSAVGVIWISMHYQTKQTKMAKEQSILEEKAKDLESIISPAIYTLAISRCIKKPNYYPVLWNEKLLIEEDDVHRLIREVLFKQVDPPTDKINLLFNFIKESLEVKYNVLQFMNRYNKGNRNKVQIDIDKLNKDIDFVNKTLGRNYELISLD